MSKEVKNPIVGLVLSTFVRFRSRKRAMDQLRQWTGVYPFSKSSN